MKSSVSKILFVGFSIVVGLTFSSCSKKTVDVPGDILTKEELVPVLVDIHLAQAAAGISQLNDSMRYSVNDYSASIFKLHHLSREKYDSSLEFYTAHPELLEEIYAEVINELSKKQGEAERK